MVNHADAVPVNQTGIFSSPARVALSALCSKPAVAPAILRAIPSHEIAKAAVFDFLFCAGDRHTQNVYVSDDASIKLIDNDNLLGEQVFKPESKFERACAVSSLFLPGTMESWRLRHLHVLSGGALGTLDYRCHAHERRSIAARRSARGACGRSGRTRRPRVRRSGCSSASTRRR